MVTLSALLYFLTYHPMWSFPLIILFFCAIGALVTMWRKSVSWGSSMLLVGFLAGMFNIFIAHYANALFLNAFGIPGTGIIVQGKQTSSTLNDQYVWKYDAVLQTADGRDIKTQFTTMSATTYPLRNAILIPPEGETFVTKYIPGFERNIVIMSDESLYGQRLRIDEDLQPVLKAEAQLAVSPANSEFLKEYREALRSFIGKHGEASDSPIVAAYKRKLESLETMKLGQ
ncbi:hypothetical protein ACFFNY_21365 [Paenibacillus hodogayensis]|uniref:Uncharacterized protein n=1 Tax=Paenibacillus hodogayensis TaxID=279208 RepID=A0ABV5W0M6_9BACL